MNVNTVNGSGGLKMADSEMCFPKTWEEFRKQYQIVDTEKVYTNGVEMIPTFRVEQWLDYMESVKRSQQLKQNKMEQVAAMFGKIIGDYVYIRDGDKPKRRYLIIDSGLYRCDGVISSKYECYIKYKTAPKMLMKLLVGKAVIVDD